MATEPPPPPPPMIYGVACPSSGHFDRLVQCCIIFRCILAAAAVVGAFCLLGFFFDCKFPTGAPVYTVAVTGVAGLEPAAPLLSPVFNLTFHIDNKRNSKYSACVPGVSSAEVSYGDAFLAKGSVPPFCAREMHESPPTAATAWGDGVVLPRFLRDKMAGELLATGDLAVDVKVTMPGYCVYCDFEAVLTCKAKIGGEQSPPCQLVYVQTMRAKERMIHRL